MVKAVFFDLWNTLLYCPTHGKVDEMLRQVGLGGKLDYGTIMEEMDNKLFTYPDYDIRKFLLELCEEKGVECPRDAIESAARMWESRLTQAEYFPETEAVLKDLHGNYKLGLISNTDRSGADYVRKIRINQYFDSMILSYEVGVVKPDPLMFKMALDDLDVRAQESWMVGDSVQADVEGALNAGMNAVLIIRDGITTAHTYPTIRSLTELRGIIK